MRYSPEIIAHLRADEEINVNLQHYRQQCASVLTGKLAIGLAQIEQSPYVAFKIQEVANQTDDAVEARSPEIWLPPGSSLKLGRIHGILPYDHVGRVLNDIFTELRGSGLMFNIHADDSLSRQHARVQLLGAGRVNVKDLGSTNGTYVLASRQAPESLRSQIRSVK